MRCIYTFEGGKGTQIGPTAAVILVEGQYPKLKEALTVLVEAKKEGCVKSNIPKWMKPQPLTSVTT